MAQCLLVALSLSTPPTAGGLIRPIIAMHPKLRLIIDRVVEELKVGRCGLFRMTDRGGPHALLHR